LPRRPVFVFGEGEGEGEGGDGGGIEENSRIFGEGEEKERLRVENL